MSSLIRKRLCSKSSLHSSITRMRLLNYLFSSSYEHRFYHYSTAARCGFLAHKNSGFISSSDTKWRVPFGSNLMRFLSSQAATDASTADGLTVEGIIANNWVIYDESESDWKSHAASIAQSIHLIKKRLRESLDALLALRTCIKEKEIEALLAGEHDPCSCFIEVQAGAGGTESMDWASMVMHMYKKWAESRHFRVTVVEEIPGEAAGIKRATIKVEGEYAFGYAKAEVGAHRLVRISPFDSAKRKHTSFASVVVIPILGEDCYECSLTPYCDTKIS